MKLGTSPDTTDNADKDLAQVLQLIEESTAKSPSYDPRSLQHFNPAVLQDFKSEIPSMLLATHVAHNTKFDQYNTTPEQFMVMNLQVYDYFSAMKFAEETIMPQFTLSNLPNITPEMIVDWIQSIHRLSARKLIEAENNRVSGEYTQELVLRWHAGTEWQLNFFKTWFFSKYDQKHNDLALINALKAVGLNRHEAETYLDLLDNLYKREDIDPREYYSKIDYSDCRNNEKLIAMSNMFHKLAIVVNLKELTTEQQIIVDKVVKVCVFPRDIPKAMHNFAVELLRRMAACEKTDEQIMDLFTWCYFTLTDIHPFGNGNGRTSIVFDDCVLGAFSYPAIALRTSEQMKDDNSSYNLAIKNINVDLGPLKAHFTLMLQAAREGTIVIKPPFLEPQTKRVQLALATEYVADGIKRLDIKSDKALVVAQEAFLTAYEGYLIWANEFLGISSSKSSTVNAENRPTSPLKLFEHRAPSSPTSANPTPQDYLMLIKSLTKLDKAQWKFSSKNNQMTFYAPVNTTAAHELKRQLEEYDDAFTVRVCKHGNSETQKLLIFEKINYKLLAELASRNELGTRKEGSSLEPNGP